ncbi:DUF1592 domain-containing protein [Cellvibrio sp. KY-GH-1]|uniref:DUF1592 domain-containing protein n=1 Tax=Cellvibrio sp. KY-GH-1 TaxID=2303332 RepID=UPI001246FD7C|nr:DUF1592 domain-containing protein [Cellvibrio sp. KY-GH-1]QEY14667.1 DUF1592 domain-containing protein [Cellvibrio sp. KY-GH-1]
MKKLLKLSMLSTSVALGIMASGGATAQGACSVDFASVNNWGSGAQYKVTLTNTGAAKTSWELCWTYAGNDVINNLWDGVYTQSGKNVCVKNAPYNPNLAANGTASFGFLVNNPGAAPTSFTLNGAACGGSASSTPSTSSASSVPSSASSSSVNNAQAARWLLDTTNSTFHFVSVKKSTAGVETPENFTFSTLQGTVSASGQATLTIPLSSINTANATRDPRMQNLLFESAYLPSMHFTTQLDLAAIEAMGVGTTAIQSVTGNLTLHGIAKSVVFDALVVKNSSGSVSFSPKKPIVINSADFDLNAGIESLRSIAGLSTIGEKVPVYFKMFLSNSNPSNTPAITLATAPTAPVSLTGTVNATGAASLNWADTSATETGFLLRRKGADGRWVTAANTAANSVSYLDSLTTAGSYDYKVISYTDSIPAAATAPLTLVYSVNTTSSGSSTSATSSVASSAAFTGVAATGATIFTGSGGCNGCHKDNNGDGLFGDGAITFNVNAFTYQTMSKYAGKGYTGTSALDLSVFIKDNMLGHCTNNACQDVAAYLWSLRGQTIASSSSSVASSVSSSSVSSICVGDSCAPTYADRSLRILSKNEYINSVLDLTGVDLKTTLDAATLASIPADILVNGFTNNTRATITENSARAYEALATKIATASAAKSFAGVATCSGTVAACGDTFVADFAKRAFRRPLTTEEKTNYATFFSSSLGVTTTSDALKLALRAVLTSPQFLYRSEMGVKVADLRAGTVDTTANITINDVPAADRTSLPDTAYVLTPYEMASFLAFTYTGSTPDATLLAAADSKSLWTKAQIEAQITRLLGTTKARSHFGNFAVQWLDAEGLQYDARDPARYPTYTTDVQKAMLEEARAIYNDVILDGAAFSNLYTSSYTFANSALASFYGLSTSGLGTSVSKVTTTNRGGLIASGAFMARNAHFAKTAPILRAVRTRRSFLCHDVPNPPTGVALDQLRADQAAAFEALKTSQGGFATARQEYHFLTSVSPCTNCHLKMINPLGFGFEDFSPIGLPRTRDDNNLSVAFQDDDGTLYGVNSVDDGKSLTFAGTKDLGAKLVASTDGFAQLRACFIENNYRMAFGTGVNYFDRNLTGSDDKPIPLPAAQQQANSVEVAALIQQMAANSNSPKVMLQNLGSLKSVRYRKDF